jgi:TctA family transporter
MAISLLLGMVTVSNTGNTFSSVLVSVPGGVGSQATILDGYPMARNGEAARALGAAFAASLLGAFFGAVVLIVSLPVLRPLVLSLGLPEFFMLCLWGVLMVGVLSGKAPLKGIIGGIMGIMIAMIGLDPKSGTPRFVFGQMYLWEGISVVLIGLSLFAVPEMVTLAVRRASIAEKMGMGSGLMTGVRDVFRHWWLMLRCSAVGVIIGVIPGLGSTVADWIAYGHAVQTEKNPETFGKGDVRGVIAPESSNNAKEGGALIPTLVFGIPGSTSLALILTVFIIVGITPGKEMLTTQLDLTFSMVWTLILANIYAAAICFVLINPLAKICFLPFYTIVPMIVALAYMGAFAAHYAWGDLITLMVLSLFGFCMRQFHWPRPPLLLGFVLGSLMEKYLWLSVASYGGISWLLRPGVIGVFLLILISVVIYPAKQSRRRRKETARGKVGL